jgi:DNA-binding response OmpR family regulator
LFSYSGDPELKLLFVTADTAITETVFLEAAEQKWSTKVIAHRDEVSASIKEYDPDMMVVDVERMVDLDWWQAQGLTELRPTLFMHNEVTEEFLSRSFEIGVDGFVPKSVFSRRYFAAQVKSYLRRQGLADARRFVPRLGLMLDSQRYRVEVRGKGLELTLTEYKILRALSTDQDVVVARREIQNQVFGEAQISKRSLDVHICALRKKLRPFGLDISSVRGVGYGLSPCTS